MNASDSKRMLDLWSNGKDTADIALIMKVHESVIYNALASMGEQKTEPYRYSRETAQEVFAKHGGWAR